MSDAKFSDELGSLATTKYSPHMMSSVKEGTQQPTLPGNTSPTTGNINQTTGSMTQPQENMTQQQGIMSQPQGIMSQNTVNNHGQSPQHKYQPSQVGNN